MSRCDQNRDSHAYYRTPRRQSRLWNWFLGIASSLLVATFIGGASWLTNLANAQSDLEQRQAVDEQANREILRRLDRIESKVDDLISRRRQSP